MDELQAIEKYYSWLAETGYDANMAVAFLEYKKELLKEQQRKR